MLRNYFKIAIRNIKRHKGYSFINIAGLAIGMACCILILMYVTDELSYDKFHEKSNRIYRINAISSIGTTSRHYAFVPPALKDRNFLLVVAPNPSRFSPITTT